MTEEKTTWGTLWYRRADLYWDDREWLLRYREEAEEVEPIAGDKNADLEELAARCAVQLDHLGRTEIRVYLYEEQSAVIVVDSGAVLDWRCL